jgi:cyclic pyranopterin monophosphate synthase
VEFGKITAQAACSVLRFDLDGMAGRVLTHVDSVGRAAMVDVAHKAITQRIAVAGARVHLGEEAFRLVEQNRVAKGDVLTVAKLAGIMAAKHTPMLIPLCHSISISSADVALTLDTATRTVDIRATARAVDRTGVEMEAMTMASVAALTVYDMCKAVCKSIVISDVRLLQKTGGKSGDYVRGEDGSGA